MIKTEAYAGRDHGERIEVNSTKRENLKEIINNKRFLDTSSVDGPGGSRGPREKNLREESAGGYRMRMRPQCKEILNDSFVVTSNLLEFPRIRGHNDANTPGNIETGGADGRVVNIRIDNINIGGINIGDIRDMNSSKAGGSGKRRVSNRDINAGFGRSGISGGSVGKKTKSQGRGQSGPFGREADKKKLENIFTGPEVMSFKANKQKYDLGGSSIMRESKNPNGTVGKRPVRKYQLREDQIPFNSNFS
jgi:hypothetical protein